MDYDKEIQNLMKRKLEDERLKAAEAIARQEYEQEQQAPIVQHIEPQIPQNPQFKANYSPIQPQMQYNPMKTPLQSNVPVTASNEFTKKYKMLIWMSTGLSSLSIILWIILLMFMAMG